MESLGEDPPRQVRGNQIKVGNAMQDFFQLREAMDKENRALTMRDVMEMMDRAARRCRDKESNDSNLVPECLASTSFDLMLHHPP